MANLRGKSFSGNSGPVDVDKWLFNCETIFENMDLTDEQKRHVVAHRLERPAQFWQESVKENLANAAVT